MKLFAFCARVLLLLACCVCIFGLVFWIWVEKQPRRRQHAGAQAGALYDAIYAMISDGQKGPKSVREVLAYAKTAAPDFPTKKYVARMTGLDPWGTAYHVETRLTQHCPQRAQCYLVVIRSFGPDKIDDGGVGDDIQLFRPCTIPPPLSSD